VDLAAKAAEHFAHGGDVGERRDVSQSDGVPGQQTGSHQHQGRILGTTHVQFAAEAPAAPDFKLGILNGKGLAR
jgi:hypothetical protein